MLLAILPGGESMLDQLATLDDRTLAADQLESVRKNDLFRGDSLLVETKNSIYAIRALGDGRYAVSGGWFDRNGISGEEISINGCTWGGTAIKQDIVAARGLFLEFGNRVVTTRIRDIILIRADNDAPGEARRREVSADDPTDPCLPL
jgi:hypothetical protein